MALTTHPLLAVKIEYGYAIPLPLLCNSVERDEFLWARIATGYGLYGPGIESLWGRDFPHPSSPALEPTHPSVQGVPGFSRW